MKARALFILALGLLIAISGWVFAALIQLVTNGVSP